MKNLNTKMLEYGLSSLSNKELIAVILGSGNKSGDATMLAESIVNCYGNNCRELSRADAKEMTFLDGIGEAKACAVAAGIELGKRISSSIGMERRNIIKDSGDVYQLLKKDYMDEKREIVYALLLNVKGELETKEIISIGELSATNIHPREVFSPAIRKGAAAIIVAHNHPSGDPTPSNEDIIATRRLIESAKILGIQLMDHVIIGDGKYVSLKAEGIIPY